MVCLGNICRSPMAEGILQEMAQKSGLNWTIESAGTNGYHSGEPPHPFSIKVAKANGIDISGQKSRKFAKSDVAQFDRIYAMATDVLDEINRISGEAYNASKVDLLMNELFKDENRDVPDPWYGTEPGYHEVYALIHKACEQIIQKHLNPEQKKYA